MHVRVGVCTYATFIMHTPHYILRSTHNQQPTTTKQQQTAKHTFVEGHEGAEGVDQCAPDDGAHQRRGVVRTCVLCTVCGIVVEDTTGSLRQDGAVRSGCECWSCCLYSQR